MLPEESRNPTDDEPDGDVYRAVRLRFVTGFAQRLSALRILLDSVANTPAVGAIEAASHAAHKMSSVGALLGFTTVSRLAERLEIAIAQSPVNLLEARATLDGMPAAFTEDLANRPPSWAVDDSAGPPARILVVEDDAEQQRIAATGLRAAGFQTLTASDGAAALRLAQSEQPDLILLDVDLPALDGLALCQQLKLDPSTSLIPIILVTSQDDLISRMAGLTIGADDHVRKPYASSEMLIRIRRLLAQRTMAGRGQDETDPCPEVSVLPFEDFSIVARDAIGGGPAALVMLRVPSWLMVTVTERLVGDLRRRDLFGRHSPAHLILLAPGLTAAEARATVERALGELPDQDRRRIAVGLAETPGGAEAAGDFEVLVAQADAALAHARVERAAGDQGATVLLADDNPDVLQIIDARLKSEGYRTLMAFDGEQALDLVAREQPDVLLLALMLPKLTGFDVLARLRVMGDLRPRTIVVSARELDTDVARAFELGADDYVSTPFNPEELVARIARLLR